MSNTKIKAAQFHGVVGHGTDGYFLMTNADGSMSWAQASTGPSVTSVTYPGDDLGADPAGGQSVILTGTNFGSSMSVSIGGTAATAVAHDSSTQLTITTPAKAAGDYDIVVTNTVTGASGTFVNGISYNGVPTWTTATGSLGTFESETTISTITLAATEPDGGTITFNITNGALPSGLSLTGANIDGTTTAESSTTLYSFTIEAIDDENQATPRNFSITVNSAELVPSQNFTINTYTGNGSTQIIEGKIGTAAEFNGSSSYIQVGNPIPNTDTDVTISAWVNLSSGVSSNMHITGTGITTSGSEGPFRITLQYQSANTFRIFALRQVAGTYYLSPNSSLTNVTINPNTWYHIVWSYTASGRLLNTFLNGTQIDTNVAMTTTGASVNDDSMIIGSFRTNAAFFNGKLDQIRIFNRALDETNDGEVTTLYNEPSNLSTASTTDIFDDGSGVALYEFEEGAKDTGGVLGYIGAGGIFNGSSSEINLPQILPPNSTSSSSFSCWFNTSDNSGTRQTIVNAYNLGGTSQAGWTLFKDAGNVLYLRSYYLDGSNITSTYGTINVSDGNWHHVAVIFDISANTLNVYLDNNSTPEISITGLTVSSVYIFESNGSIGYQTNSARHFNGKIDQVRIFSKALSSSEVTTLSDETSASATKSTTDIFDDSSGVALYELEGNAKDTGLYGSGAIDAGQSAVFNGSSSYIDTNISTITSNSGSVSLWVKTTTGTQSNFFGGQSPSQNRFYFGVRNNNFWMGAGDSQNSYNISASSLLDGNWHHVVLTLDGSTAKYYLDGNSTPVDTLSYTSAGTIGVTPLIGALDATGSILAYTNGSIDQVRIYSSALSSSDVEALASETNVPTANLVAHYKLDGDATDEIASNNGTWSGTQAYSDPAEFPAYDGTATNVTYGYNGTPTNVSFVGTSFQPDLVWIKGRDTYTLDHVLTDSVRGVNKKLASNTTASEVSPSVHGAVGSFDSNGFTTIAGSSTSLEVNHSGVGYVAWCWKAGGNSNTYNVDDTGYSTASDAGLSSANGTTLNGASVNTEAGFSIINYETNINGDNRPAHGLTQEPELIIFKPYDTSSLGWYVMTKKIDGSLDFLFLNTRDAKIDTANNEFINSTHFRTSLGTSWGSVIAYCFHSVDGYQKIGSYTSNASVKITTGFEPRWIMIKYTGGTNDWWIMDTSRYDGSTGSHGGKLVKPYLEANENFSEQSVANGSVEFVSDGFYPTNFYNSNGVLYLAIA